MEKEILQNIKKYGNLPSLIKELRSEKGYSLQSLANILDISTTTLRNYEKGDTFPDESNLIRILSFFKLDASSLMSESYSKTEEIRELLKEEYFTINRRIELLNEQLHWYQILADDIKKVIEVPVTQESIEAEAIYTDDDYQYSGIGDTFLENILFLEKGRYRIKGYFKPGKDKYSYITIQILSSEDSNAETGIRYQTPYQPFSKILRVPVSGNYKINIDCNDNKKWAFSILTL